MEVTRRRLVNGVTSNSSSKVPLDQIYALEVCEVPATDEKFAGYMGCSVRALLGAAKSGTGVFIAGDGMQTEPIAIELLVLGILMHTDASGNQPLQQGGPLRVWFPPECGLRCGKGNNLAVKDVKNLTLTITPGTHYSS
jgi:hypothetical protein